MAWRRRRAPTRASADYLGKPVAAVRLVVEGARPTELLLPQIVETGRAPLSMAEVRESLTHLFSLGRFEDVRVDATLEGGGVALRYELVPIHPVSRIRFAGCRRARRASTRTRCAAPIADRCGTSPPLGRAADMTRMLDDALRERGYLHAAVTPRAEIEHDARARHAGLHHRSGAADDDRRPSRSSGRRRARPSSARALDLSPGAPYQREVLNARIERYIEDVARRGYYEAKASRSSRWPTDDRVANMTLTVTPGRTSASCSPAIRCRRTGAPSWCRSSAKARSTRTCSRTRATASRSSCARRATATPRRRTRARANGELVITFAVKRGPAVPRRDVRDHRQRLGAAGRVRAGLRLRDGQPFSAAQLDADVQTIEELYTGAASRRRRCSRRSSRTPTPPPAQVPVAVRVVVTEGRADDGRRVTLRRQPGDRGRDAARHVALQPGAPFVPAQLAVDRDAILLATRISATRARPSKPGPTFTATARDVPVAFTVREGPQVFVDHVLIVGNVRTSTETIERELQVRPAIRSA